jgi:vacuolar-type H+-ATPase subunit E/Vma4
LSTSDPSKIIEKILNDARSEAERIVSHAKAEAEVRRMEARKRADAEVEAAVSKFRRVKEEEARRIVVEAKVKAKERWLKEREELINQAIEKVKEKLAEVTKSLSYVKVLESLIEEAAVAIGGGDLMVEVNDRDSKLNLDLEGIAKAVSSKTGVNTKIELSKAKLRCMGGAVVSSKDGRFTYDNTFESRLERLSSTMRLTASKILFAGLSY